MAFSAGQVLTAAQLNDLDIDSLVVDTNVLVVDKTHNRVGVGTASPDVPLHVSIGTENTGITVTSTDTTARMSFVDSTTSGNFHVGIGAQGDSLKLWANNAIRLEHNGSQLLSQPNGTAAAPAYSFDSDSNTGFFIAGNNGYTAWSGNGTEGGRLYSTGVRAVNGSNSSPAYSFFNDTDSGFYRASSNVIGISTAGVERARIYSGGYRNYTDGTAALPGYHFGSDNDCGMYLHATGQVGISGGGSAGLIAAGGTINSAGLATSSLSGFQYVLRNTTFGTLYHYTSMAETKENITNVTASDAAAWIDALQPVTFNERWLQEGTESAENRAYREADMQVGFIADDVLANSTTAKFAQVKDVDGTLKGVGWKWECVIAAAVAEIKSLRTRVAALEA